MSDGLLRALADLGSSRLDHGRSDEEDDLRPLLAASIRIAQRGPRAMADAHELARKLRRAGLRVVTGGGRG